MSHRRARVQIISVYTYPHPPFLPTSIEPNGRVNLSEATAGCLVTAKDGRNPILSEKGSRLKFSGNEVYYTNSSISLVKNMLHSKLRCKKVVNLIPFSCNIPTSRQKLLVRWHFVNAPHGHMPFDPKREISLGTSLIRNSPPPLGPP